MQNNNVPQSEDRIIDTNEVCTMGKASVWTVVKWCTRKRDPLPSFKLGHRMRRFSRNAVLEWFAAQGRKLA